MEIKSTASLAVNCACGLSIHSPKIDTHKHIALEDENHYSISLENNRVGMKRMIDFFDKHKFDYIPSCTNFVTLKFKDEDKGNSFVNNLLIEGIIVRNLKSFGLPKYVRVTIGTSKEIDALFEKINKMESVLY